MWGDIFVVYVLLKSKETKNAKKENSIIFLGYYIILKHRGINDVCRGREVSVNGAFGFWERR